MRDERPRRIFPLGLFGQQFPWPRGFDQWLTVSGGVILATITVVTIAAPLITPFDPTLSYFVLDGKQIPLPPLQHPGSAMSVETAQGTRTLVFPFGTDELGRDVFARVVHGARFVLLVALASSALSIAVGLPVGLFAGFVGGRLDRVLTLVMDSIYAFPGLILAIAIAAVLGPGVLNLALAIAVVYVPSYYRVVRGQVLAVKELPYVEAARGLGAKAWTLLTAYIFPNVLPSVVVILSVNFADAILTEAGLSFLGLGLPEPTPDWGADLNSGRGFFLSGSWWLGAFPGVMIVVSALGFSLLGEGLNERWNPRLRDQE